MLIEKFKTVVWFARRPETWAFALELGSRKVKPDREGPEFADAATAWAAARACTIAEALKAVGLLSAGASVPQIDGHLLEEANQLAQRAHVQMGGPGDLALLYAAVVLSRAELVLETGVAYGWSSLATLAGLSGRMNARLVSIDMPYPKRNNEEYVGIAVPERLRHRWILIREPDRRGIEKGINLQGGTIDLCHYDSDKSWYGRKYGYPLLWDALRPGGVFISDDISDNMAFAEFVQSANAKFAVTESNGKFVGIVTKPL